MCCNSGVDGGVWLVLVCKYVVSEVEWIGEVYVDGDGEWEVVDENCVEIEFGGCGGDYEDGDGGCGYLYLEYDVEEIEVEGGVKLDKWILWDGVEYE